jgi:hypothetical protein
LRHAEMNCSSGNANNVDSFEDFAIVTWISEYYGRAIAEMRAGGHLIQDEVLAHLWPTHHDNVNFFGTITVDIDGELAKLDTDGYRPLRHIPATASTVN